MKVIQILDLSIPNLYYFTTGIIVMDNLLVNVRRKFSNRAE